jgi:hypothetical protein
MKFPQRWKYSVGLNYLQMTWENFTVFESGYCTMQQRELYLFFCCAFHQWSRFLSGLYRHRFWRLEANISGDIPQGIERTFRWWKDFEQRVRTGGLIESGLGKDRDTYKLKSLCLTYQALRYENVWVSGCIDPRILDLSTSWRWVASFTPRLLYPQEKIPHYPLDRRLCEPQNQSGHCGEENILDPTGTWIPTPRPSSP